MSKEQLKAFIAKFKYDQSITHKLKKAKTAKQVAGIAKQYSHEFTDEHVTQLSKKDFDGVASGAFSDKESITCQAIGIAILLSYESVSPITRLRYS